MNRDAELSLIERCLDHYHSNRTTTGPHGSSDAARYISEERFELEMARVIRVLPFPAAHVTDVREPNTFRTLDSSLGGLVLTRDEQGASHLFHNSCRHRGSTLVSAQQGSTARLTCPYHAWSYSTDGALAFVPEQEQCFPGIDKSQLGLLEVPSVERYGFIWACPGAGENAELVLQEHLGDMGPCLDWLQIEKLNNFGHTCRRWQANWKIFSEGGLETYHFAFAHRETIGPNFKRNLAITDALGPHFRMIMPTAQIDAVAQQAPQQRQLRDFTHTLFTLMPTDSLLMQKEHVDWIKFRPTAPGETEITITSLIPDDPRKLSEKQRNHWQRNLDITDTVLTEDFELGVGIQRSLSCRAIQQINYGSNEWALKAFNEALDGLCARSCG